MFWYYMDMDIFYTTSQAAEYLKLNERTIRRMIARGTLKATNVGTDKRPTWRIHDSDIQRLSSESYIKLGEK